MANTNVLVISASDYQTIADKYGYIRSHMTTASGYLYDAVYTIVRFNDIEPTLDLLQPFYDTYQIARRSLLDNSLFLNAVRALNSHVLNRATQDDGTAFSSLDSWLHEEAIYVSSQFAAISKDAGFTIGTAYHG